MCFPTPDEFVSNVVFFFFARTCVRLARGGELCADVHPILDARVHVSLHLLAGRDRGGEGTRGGGGCLGLAVRVSPVRPTFVSGRKAFREGGGGVGSFS